MIDDSTAFAPSCSVVVCTRNRPEALDRCLGALAQVSYLRFDVLVVDNAPSDDRGRTIAKRWGVRYLVEPSAGLSRARNAGARACSAEIVAFTDDDAVPEPEWLSRLAAEFRDPSVTVVTGRTLSLFRGLDPLNAPEHVSDLGPHAISVDRSHSLWFEMACFGGIGNGNNMAFRRAAFDIWSGFDERLGRGARVSSGEEHRAFAHLIEAGHKVIYAPGAIVHHPVPQTLQERRAEYLRSRADLTGFAVFLFIATRHKWRVTKYVIEAALGTKRGWRFHSGRLPAGLVPRWRILLAYLSGPWHCVRACFRTGPRASCAHSWDGARERARAEARVLRLAGK